MVERRPGVARDFSKPEPKPTVFVQYLDRNGKIRLDLGPTRHALMLDLDETITEFYRSKKKTALRSDQGTEQYYIGNCRSATQDFGRLLAKQTDEDNEAKFFDRHPGAKYYDFEKTKPTKGAFAQFDFHSIGFLQIPDPEHPQRQYFIVFDLTYNAVGVDKDTRTLIVHGNDQNTVMQELNKIYGGNKWEIYKLNPQKGTYEFTE
jgi:hypothetical protein